jgi:hypothetical protein
MASEVAICNMALSHFGENGTVVSISPPDGSAEAGHCARFFAIARADVLEMYEWAFAKKRTTLAALTSDSAAWIYKFAKPSDCLKVRKLLPYGAFDETKSLDYEVEGDAIYCNDENPTLIYTRLVVDTTKYTSLFTSAFSYMLASYVSGPMTKKAATVKALRDMALAVAAQGAATDANASSSETHYSPAPWMGLRGAGLERPEAGITYE